jgi:oxygen-independent coproporphyrinogen-3 oxidase
MVGIYIHIPFCASRCIYCAFYSTTSLDLRQRYIEAVCREIQSRHSDDTVSTIYLGGGTPSQLSASQLQLLFDTLYIYYKVSPDAEITIEANPDDVTPEFATVLQQLPINRVSMGAQTFDDVRLQCLHRRHNSRQVGEAVSRLRQAGVQNISVDLMYGFPHQTQADWEQDISAVLALGVEHISAYCLSIEEGTELWRKVESGKWKENTEEAERLMYYTLIDRLEAAGFEHYEISNFARPGYRSRHNTSYWTGIPYIGLGAAAHSFDGCTRSWNIDDIRQYIDGIEHDTRRFDSEPIEGDTAYNDQLTTALRTREGLDLRLLSERQRAYCRRTAQRFIDDGLLTLHDEHLSLARRGLFVSDMIISELMLIESLQEKITLPSVSDSGCA